MLREPSIKLGALSIREWYGSAVVGDAVPKIFDKRQALLNAQPIDPKGFQCCAHNPPYGV